MKTQGIRHTPTRQNIRQATLRLAAAKPIGKVTISEICREAGIHRSTFYKHYGTQFEVMEDILHQLVANTADYMMACLQEGCSMRSALCQVLGYIQSNQDQIRLLLDQSDYAFFQAAKTQLPDFQAAMEAALPAALSPAEKEACACFVQYGTLHLLLEWVKAGCPVPPRQEAELIFSILGRTLRF